MPKKPITALLLALGLWVIGFVWGSIVFMTPLLKAAAPIAFVSSNPWISFPILVAWLPICFLLAKRYLRSVHNPAGEGMKLGIVFSVSNFVLDLLVLVIAFNTGFQYFASLSVIAGYVLLFLVPWWASRSLSIPDTA